MILTVTPNPALDITHEVESVAWGGTTRVTAAHARAGGKGVNTARVLAALGVPAVVLAPLGGPVGRAVRDDLRSCGLAEAATPIAGETRRTVTVVESGSGTTTVLNEPGPTVTGEEWRALEARFAELLPDATAVSLAGSLPPGAPDDGYARLIRLARRAGVPALLDTSGAALRAGIGAGPDLVKPNADELAELTGDPDPCRGAALLLRRTRAAGGSAVIASLGPDGLLAATTAGWWRARLPYALRGNPTGAGDTVSAALLAAPRRPWPDRLADAVAWSASTVASPVAGAIDRTTYATARAHVLVSATQPPPTGT